MAIDLHCHIFPPEYLRLARTQGERIGAQIYRRDDGREFIRAPGASLDRIYVDSMVYLPSALSWLVGEIGSDHIVVGSDYPFDIGPDDPTEIVREAPGLTAEDRENILRRTAWKLLGVEIGRET